MREGQRIEVIDSHARCFEATIQTTGSRVQATLDRAIEQTVSRLPNITVAQGIPKASKMDFVVEKLTELGAAAIVPLQSERTIPSQVSGAKLERWRRLARTAAQQSGRSDIPNIAEPATFASLISTFERYECTLLPWELAETERAHESLAELVSNARRILVLIGPEGGFSHEEAALAREAGAHIVSLGPRILRTETAGPALLAVLNYVFERTPN